MKIYTKTGDTGQTSLFGGQRVEKDHPRLATYGTVDELNAHLGLARAALATNPASFSAIDNSVARVQNELFDLGAELATPTSNPRTMLIQAATITALEDDIDHFEQALPPLKAFILPAGTEASCRLHIARCVCRRAERELAQLMRDESIRGELIAYLNRLSDLLFVLARAANHQAGVGDVEWQKSPG
ncbi:cob(I)yrinic acid a,c-diamide adenosyltransferase [Aeoliella mucimassa]|nr:cob(I)yrinic acid a,c-diamide adenosyltransferase [Aeoliella mucimassa]